MSERIETYASQPEGFSTSPDPAAATVGQLVGEAASDLSKLMRLELDLAKAEIKEEAKKAGKGAGLLGAAGFAGYLVVLFASLALMFALGSFLPLGWAALIVAILWAIVGAVAYSRGRAQMKTVSPKPEQTIETLKEDAEWAKHPTK
ncbi:MAG: phage holin family protein [Mycobacteriales bacterium]